MTADLLPLLQSATVGSRELDEAVLRVAGWTKNHDPALGDHWVDPVGNRRWVGTPSPTRSLDAVTALIAARGRMWETDAHGYASVLGPGDVLSHCIPAIDGKKPPALALCLAFVRAVEGKNA